jgi:hypothetical protein
VTTSIPESLLSKVRKLLAKAEDDGATQAEAEALTAKAAELMARYGIEQAMLGDATPGSDRPGDRIVICDAPYAGERANLLYQLASAMRCQGIQLSKQRPGTVRMHLFGYASDLERVEVLYTSILLQMTSALAAQEVPYYANPRAYRRSWLAGYRRAVVARVEAAESRAEQDAAAETSAAGRGGELVLADRRAVVRRQYEEAYPDRRMGRASSYSGGGNRAGYAAGQRANIGGTHVGGGARRGIGGAR